MFYCVTCTHTDYHYFISIISVMNYFHFLKKKFFETTQLKTFKNCKFRLDLIKKFASKYYCLCVLKEFNI